MSALPTKVTMQVPLLDLKAQYADLRAEIDDAVRSNLKYLDCIRRKVEALIKRNRPREAVRDIDIESCGKSRIPLNGLVTQLHTANLLALYDRLKA